MVIIELLNDNNIEIELILICDMCFYIKINISHYTILKMGCFISSEIVKCRDCGTEMYTFDARPYYSQEEKYYICEKCIVKNIMEQNSIYIKKQERDALIWCWIEEKYEREKEFDQS